MTTLTKAPAEPTNGDVMIAVETLRNAGADISNKLDWQNPQGSILVIELPINERNAA